MENDVYIVENQRIVCNSSSGNQYFITKSACSCKGYGFRRKCRHYSHCSDENLFSQLDSSKPNKINFNSPYIKKMRLDALVQFCIKNRISYNNQQLDKIVPQITIMMTPEYLKNLLTIELA